MIYKKKKITRWIWKIIKNSVTTMFYNPELAPAGTWVNLLLFLIPCQYLGDIILIKPVIRIY